MDDWLADVELFAALEGAARAELAAIAHPFALAEGALLFRQGDPPSGLYLVGEGALEIATRMPGDDAAQVSRIAPGEVVGEFALLDDGPRSAHVRALAATRGWPLPARSFAALLADARPGAVAAIDALRGLVARRTRATLERLADGETADACELRAAAAAASTHPVVSAPLLLRALPAFIELSEDACAELLAVGALVEASRGTALVAAGATPDSALLVVRGAVRASFARGDRREQVCVHAPGEWAGLVATIDRAPHPLALDAAETAILLRVPAETFARWRAAPDAIGQAVLAGVDRQLVRDQRRANRHLGRAIALERFNAAGVAA